MVTSNAPGNSLTSPQIKNIVYLGDFTNLTMGVRLEATVEIVKAADYVGNLLYDFIGVARVDFLCTRPSAFCTLERINVV